jgi:hypothetical protein
MSQENVEIVRQIYASIAVRPESIRHLYAADYEIDLTDIAPDIGVVSGFDGQNEALRPYLEAFDGFHIEIDEVISATEDQALLAIYDGGRMHGVDTEIRNLRFHLWNFRGGQVVRLSSHLDRTRALEAAGLGEVMSREERIAENEAFCRDLNRSKEDWLRAGVSVAGFRCECWRLDCGVRLRLSRSEWREVRSRPERFAVAPGHTAIEVEPGVEEVVKEYEHFWIVEKRGEAGDIAARRE